MEKISIFDCVFFITQFKCKYFFMYKEDKFELLLSKRESFSFLMFEKVRFFAVEGKKEIRKISNR